MNKVLASFVMGVSLTVAGVAQADSEQGQQLVDCKQQLEVIYGADARVRIGGKSAVNDPTLKLRVYPQGERFLRVSCTRTPEGAVSLANQYGIALFEPQQRSEEISVLGMSH